MSFVPSKAVLIAAIALMTAFGIGLRFRFLEVPVKRAGDEQVYTFYAKVLAEKGIQGIRESVDAYNTDEQRWKFPPPIRVGYLAILSSFMKVSGITTEEAGALVSRAFSVFSLLVLVLIGVRFFNAWVTLTALWFMSVSLPELMIARRAWQDGVMGFFSSLLIYVCAEIVSAPKRKIWYPVFWALGMACLVIKESGIVIYGLCVLWILWKLFFREKNVPLGLLFGALSLVAVEVVFFSLSQLAGGLPNLMEVFRHMREAMPSNEYAVRYQEGPWYFLIQDFWILSPVATFLAFVGAAGALGLNLDFKKKGIAPGFVYLMFVFAAIGSFPHYFKNLRYFSVLYVLFYLLCGIGAWTAFSVMRLKLKSWALKIAVTAMVLVLIWGGWRDYRLYQYCCIENDVPDLPHAHFSEIAKMRGAHKA